MTKKPAIDPLTMLEQCQTPGDFAAFDRQLEELLSSDDATAGPRVVRTLGEVAGFFGLASQTVRAWRMENPPLPGRPGCYSLDEIDAWKSERESRTRTGDMSELSIQCRRAELMERLQRARGRKMKNDAVVSRLINRAELVREFPKMNAIVERHLCTLPERVAAVSPPDFAATLREVADKTVEISLKEYHNGVAEMFESL